MKQFLRCLNKKYDAVTDSYWVRFRVEPNEHGYDTHIEFDMPINDEDFEVGNLYRITFHVIEYETLLTVIRRN
jgi:hypothetical protein